MFSREVILASYASRSFVNCCSIYVTSDETMVFASSWLSFDKPERSMSSPRLSNVAAMLVETLAVEQFEIETSGRG